MFRFLKTLAQIDIDPNDLDVPKATVDDTSVATVLEVMFSVMGIISMLIIVIAGMLFSLSRGNPEKAGKARNAVIYAAVGLVIAMSAFAIVRLVVREVA